MKSTVKLAAALGFIFTLNSCTVDDLENDMPKKEFPVSIHSEVPNSMMLRDSLTRDGEIDPPTKPKP